MGSPEKDYLHKGWMAAAALIAALVGVSFIPPQSLGGRPAEAGVGEIVGPFGQFGL